MAGRTVVPFEADHGGARKIVLEAQDVVDLGAAPAIDRLVVVADAADVVPPLRQQPQPEVLDDVGVLVLVDQHVPEAVLILLQDIRVLAEQAHAFEQQIAEIGCVQRLQACLIGRIELPALAVGESRRLAGRNGIRVEPAVLPAVDQVGEAARRPALLVDVLGLDHLLHQADLVVCVEDGEARLEPHKLGMPAQDLGRDRMERAEPGHALGHRTDEDRDALLHLPRGLVGEGHRQDLVGFCAPGGDDVGDAGRQHARLARARAGQHQHRPVEGLDGLPLFRIEAGEIGRRHPASRALRQPARTGGHFSGGNELGQKKLRFSKENRMRILWSNVRRRKGAVERRSNPVPN